MKARIQIPNPGTTEHTIKGAQCDGHYIIPKDLVVRITSDNNGKSLSISNEEDLMFMIPLEPVLNRLKAVVK